MDKYLVGVAISWILAIVLAVVLAFTVFGCSVPTYTKQYAVSNSDPFMGTTASGEHPHWNYTVLRVAWTGEYDETDVSILEETFFEFEQNTNIKFIVVDPTLGQPQILVHFYHPDQMGFPWEENWAGITSLGWYPDGTIANGVMVYIDIDAACEDNARENCIKHELGHAMGMGHNIGTNIMNPGIEGYTEFSAEDVMILKTLYS